MASPAREQWLQALRAGNCLLLKQLLKDNPSLLKVTWEAASKDAAQSQSLGKLKGRNVLHVAAWRGCVELIKDVLRLCNLTEIDDLSRVDEQGAAAESENVEDIAPATVGESELADSDGAQRDEQTIASNEQSSSAGDQQNLEESAQAGEEIGPADGGLEVPMRDLSNRQLRERGLEMAQRTVAHRKSRVERGRVNSEERDGKNLRTTSGDSLSYNDLRELLLAKDGEFRLQPFVAQRTVAHRKSLVERGRVNSEERDGKNLRTTSGDSLPNNDLRELLLAKDGEFGLQPIVMAGFHMNVNVLVLLGYAYAKCASDLLGSDPNIGSDRSPGPLVYVEDEAHRENRARLRVVTERFIAKLGNRYTSAQLGPGPESEKRGTTREACVAKFLRNLEFNFLPIEEYFFHFICVTWFWGAEDIIWEFWNEIRSFPFSSRLKGRKNQRHRAYGPGELWRFVLELKDGQGRTPIHAAINSRRVEELLQVLSYGKDDAEEVIVCALTTPDAATRMPAHTAAVGDYISDLEAVLRYARQYDEVSASCRWTQQVGTFKPRSNQKAVRKSYPSQSEKFYVFFDYAVSVLTECVSEIPIWESHVGEGRFRGDLLYQNKFSLERSCTPFHAAVLTRSYDCAKLLIKASDQLHRDDMSYYQIRWDSPIEDYTSKYEEFVLVEAVRWDPMEFACLVGADSSFVDFLKEKEGVKSEGILKQDYLEKPKAISVTQVSGKHLGESANTIYDILQDPIPVLHIVAAHGNYKLLKLFIDDPTCIPFVEDFEGNTALHYAMSVGELCFTPFFLDYPSCEHFAKCQRAIWGFEDKKIRDVESQFVERQGCINLLLQAGCDVFKVNKNKQVPYPQNSLSSNGKFLSWWHDRQDREFGAAQNNLNFAANAISVTATLVATASYVGPLQPPMGYAGDPNQLQDQNVWVLLFIVCDTISFYLAIAAITYSLIPSLPMPQQSMSDELDRTRRMVTSAVSILLPAIIFVFLAFGASSFAVLSANITSSVGGYLTIVTTVVGGLFCLRAFLLFFIRLVAFAYPANSWVRFLYRFTLTELANSWVRFFYSFTLTELWARARSYLHKLPHFWSLSKSGDPNGPTSKESVISKASVDTK
ncbi:unnamed protein product [Calypogeia fissa]